MNDIKKILVLKEVCPDFSIHGKVSAIFRIEIENGLCSLFLSVINILAKPNGNYTLYILDSDNNIYNFNLGNKPLSFTTIIEKLPNLDNGIAVSISYSEKQIIQTIAYSADTNFNINLSTFNEKIAGYYIKQNINNINVNDFALDNKINENFFDEHDKSYYDDEVVATENYFDDSELKEKLEIIEKMESEQTMIEEQKLNDEEFTKSNNQVKYDKTNPYFNTVKQQLDELFLQHEEEVSLKNSLPNSKWIRVKYSSNKYYVVGIINENEKAKYICYGVPSPYQKEPPKELKGFCSFIPLSIFALKGDGYFMMFQDAITGECVKIN